MISTYKVSHKIAKVQRYFTKRIAGLWNMSYDDRLHTIGLQSLEDRRVFNDLVLCYGLIDTDIDFIVVSNLYTRGHSNKLMKQHCTIDATKFYFSNRVVSIWNSLSEYIYIVSAPSVSAFKNRLLQFKSGFDVIFMCYAWFLLM